ncbi:hypothetical protein CU097_001015, partial [Rhizopus azygosporus]
FKVDMRLVNDKIKQCHSIENDVSIMEATEEYAGDAKFVSDRCKLSIENKTITDRFLLDSVKTTSIDSLQICGLEERGLYASTELKHYKVDNAIKNIKKYIDLVVDLLCFRDECIFTSNKYEKHLIREKKDEDQVTMALAATEDAVIRRLGSTISGSWL